MRRPSKSSITSHPRGFSAATSLASACCRCGTCSSTSRAWMRSNACSGSGSVPMSWRRSSRCAGLAVSRPLHETRVDVRDQHRSGWPDALRHPGRDRTAAAADLQAVPARPDAGRLQETEGAEVVERVEAREALRGLGLRGVVEDVGRSLVGYSPKKQSGRIDVSGSLPLRLDVVGACYCCPFRALLVEHGAKLARSCAARPDAEIDEALFDLRLLKNLAHLGCDSLLQCRRHVLRTEQPEQAAEREVRIACLGNGRDPRARPLHAPHW